MIKKIRALAAVLTPLILMTGCGMNGADVREKAESILSRENNGPMTEEKLKDMLNELGLDPSQYDVKFETGGAVIDLKDDTVTEDGIKRINLDKRAAALLAAARNLKFVEVRAGDKTYRLDRETLMRNFNINLDEISSSKDKFTDFIKGLVK